jgi:hypothetical protein
MGVIVHAADGNIYGATKIPRYLNLTPICYCDSHNILWVQGTRAQVGVQPTALVRAVRLTISHGCLLLPVYFVYLVYPVYHVYHRSKRVYVYLLLFTTVVNVFTFTSKNSKTFTLCLLGLV